MSAAPSALRMTLFASLALAAILVQMVPLGVGAGGVAMPDLLLLLAAAWTVRRPADMPLLLSAGLFLLADLMLHRAVGLWAFLSLMLVEALAVQRDTVHQRPFPVEWGAFAAALAAAMTFRELVLRMTLVERPALDMVLVHYAATVLAYPAVVLALRTLFGVRAPRPAERSRRLARVG